MTKCPYTGKEIRCPRCNSTVIHFYFDVDKTVMSCHGKKCETTGKIQFVTYHPSHPDYPKVIKEIGWYDEI